MKKILFKHAFALQLLLVTGMLIFISSCEDENETGKPAITEVRNYAASPEDVVITTLNTGQWVVMLGSNLKDVSAVYFGSVRATLNSALSTEGSIVVQVPSIPFQSIPLDKINEITVVSEGGVATFTIDIVGPPIISYIRNYADSPNDTITDAIVPGQQVNLIGFNLKGATEILFQGIQADLSQVIYSDSSAVVNVPASLSGSDAALANMISYTTDLGESTFSVKIIGPPVIKRVSLENPKEGDLVYLYGDNLTSIESLTFAGTIITSYEVSPDGTQIEFIAPALTQGGPVEITTPGGAFTTAYNVNDISTGAISNFEWDGKFQWDWWGGASLAVDDASKNEGWIADFPEFSGNGSKFLALNVAILASGGGADWNTAVRITDGNAVPWFPSVDNLSDPASSWALKFEMNVSQNWNGGTLVIKTSNADYMVRYEPWQVSPTNTADFKTDGWQTVVIPLNSFRRNDSALGDGRGAPIAQINELFNMGSTTTNLLMYLHNYGAADTKTGLRAAFDNIRVVRQ